MTVSFSPDQLPELLHGDVLEIAPQLPHECFRMIYIDPPFFTNKEFKARGLESAGFKDNWGKNGIEAYLSFLKQRITLMRDLLTKDGSLLLHLDWRAIHYAKVMCDEIFGMDCFQNELIWSYRSGGGSKNRYGRKHDTILWYGRSKKAFFDRESARVPYDAVIAKKWEHKFNPDGKVCGDVLDISRPPNHSKEWTGWPTQKPLDLLRFLVKVHSAPGDLVGDLFCGSGTTLVAAKQEGRKYFGCDISQDALNIAQNRLDQTNESDKSNSTPSNPLVSDHPK